MVSAMSRIVGTVLYRPRWDPHRRPGVSSLHRCYPFPVRRKSGHRTMMCFGGLTEVEGHLDLDFLHQVG